jgi:DNA invertase Pin-like site-specific DNA recombinase
VVNNPNLSGLINSGGVKMKVALYGRVSTSDQNPESQLVALRKLAEALGGEVVGEYVDYMSGGSPVRKEFLKSLADAEAHKYEVLLFWALDRFSREGISNTLGYLKRLERCGVAVKSLQESWLDTRDKGMSELLLAVFSWAASQERQRISERVKSGLERVKREGRKLGRPLGSTDKKKRSVSGYHLRYKGVPKELRRLGPRKENKYGV